MSEIDSIRDLANQVRRLIEEASSPAVAMSLTRSLQSLSLAASFLGDDSLGPEVPETSSPMTDDACKAY